MDPHQFHPTPFKGLVPYSEEDAQYFFGREDIRDTIIAHLETWRLTLLYGASGVGKSSVLHAGVIPTIRSLSQQSLNDPHETVPEFSIVMFNQWRDDPVNGLARSIHQHLAQLLGEGIPPLPDGPALSSALDQWAASTDCQLYVILDQFEEYFQYHGNEDGPGSFARELPRAIARQNQRFRFLISIREDAVAKLDLFTGRVPNLFDHILRVRPLTVEEARKAIEGPIDRYNTLIKSAPVAIEDELLDVVLQSVQGTDVTVGRGAAAREPGGIDATILQQVMVKLWQEDVERSGSNSLQLATFERLGRAKNIVSTHFSAAMELLSRADRKIAAVVFRYLVTPSGTKIAQTAKDLSYYSELSEASVTAVLERLTAPDVRIVRAISPPPDRPDDVRYEIFHDVLSGPINEWWRRYENDERVERIRNEATTERAIARARSQRLFIGVLSVAVVLLLAATAYAFVQKSKAETAGAIANETAKREIKAKQGEEAAKKEALMQARLADDRAAEADKEREKTAEANKLALTNLALAKAAEAKADERARVANTALTIANNARQTDSAQRAAFRLSRRKDKREEAIVEIEKAFAVYNASKDPEDRLATIDTLLNLGEVYLDLGNETDAIKAFTLAYNKSQNFFERAATLTSIGDIYQEIVKSPFSYDPLRPYIPWSPYAVEFNPKARAILNYEGAIRIYDKLRGDLRAKVKSDHPSFNEPAINSLAAGVFVSLGVAKIETARSKPPEQRQQIFDEGVGDIKSGITLYDDVRNHQGKAYALLALADAKTTPYPTQYSEEVMKILQQSLAEYQAASNPKGKIQVHRKMARAALPLQPRESINSLAEIVNIYKSINDKPGTAAALVDLAASLTRLPIDSNAQKTIATRLDELKRLYLEAADLYEEAEWHDKAAETLMTAVDQVAYMSTADAEPLLERSTKLFGKSGRWEHQINVIRRLIIINASSNQEKTNKLLNEISVIASKLLKPEDKALAEEQLGHAYILAKQFDKADAAVVSAVMSYRARNDKLGALSAQHRIATTYLEQSAPDKAIEYLNRALEDGIKSWNGTLYSSLGDAYVKKNDITKAISFYEQALQTFKEKGDSGAEAQTLVTMSRVFRDRGRYDEAISSLEKAISLHHSSSLYYLEGPTLVSLAEVYDQKGDINLAIETYSRADRIYIEKGAPSFYRVGVAKKLSELYTKTGDPKKAEEYKQLADKLNTGP